MNPSEPQMLAELCEQGFHDYIAHHPEGSQQGFMSYMLQNYYGSLLAFGDELSRGALLGFAAQMGLPDVT